MTVSICCLVQGVFQNRFGYVNVYQKSDLWTSLLQWMEQDSSVNLVLFLIVDRTEPPLFFIRTGRVPKMFDMTKGLCYPWF